MSEPIETTAWSAVAADHEAEHETSSEEDQVTF
jgi:hypothetical protein